MMSVMLALNVNEAGPGRNYDHLEKFIVHMYSSDESGCEQDVEEVRVHVILVGQHGLGWSGYVIIDRGELGCVGHR